MIEYMIDDSLLVGTTSQIEIDMRIKEYLANVGFDLSKEIMCYRDIKKGVRIYRQTDSEQTNRQYFFGNKMIADTIMLLTYENHQRPECRLFKKVLSEMNQTELLEWLDSPKDKRFNW